MISNVHALDVNYLLVDCS